MALSSIHEATGFEIPPSDIRDPPRGLHKRDKGSKE